MAAKNILILGGGAGGVVSAYNILKKLGKDEVNITLIDRTGYHVFQPSQVWVMTGQREPDDIRRPLKLLERRGVKVVLDEVETIKPEDRLVVTNTGKFSYDYLIVALGSLPETSRIPGYDQYNICTPWTIEGALKCRKLLGGFKKGSVVVAPLSLPYKCPPAPLEVAFMIKYLLDQRGVASESNVTVLHTWKDPMEPFGPPIASVFKKFMETYGIDFMGSTEIEVFEEKNVITRKGEKIKYDLAVVVPPHSPPEPVANSDLGDPSVGGYMKVDKKILRSPKYDDVYGVGDVIAPSIGIGMAGVFAHFQAEHIASRIVDDIKGAYMGEHYNMGGPCVMDMGYIGAVAYCDFTKRILEGKLPDCAILGGMRAFRAAKYAFERYWLSKWF